MRRAKLEAELRALGYAPIGQASGRGHHMWTGRGRAFPVPTDELINDSVAEAILALARKVGFP